MNAVVSVFNGRPPTAANFTHPEIWEKSKKYTIYKVNLVTTEGKNWVIFKRYNEFHKLYEILKKQLPSLHLKLPGKKLFGNNFDPIFIKSRREGLDDFVRRLVTEPLLFKHPFVQTFLGLENLKEIDDQLPEEDNSDETNSLEKDDKPVNLGPSEKLHAKPSDFEFLRVIGKGSFGKVLLAKYKADGQVFAVKVLQKKVILKRNEARHIMSERNVLLKNLNHPFLVGLHFSFQTSEKLYFVLDYVNGGELFFHLQQERFFTEFRAKFYAAEIACAIGYLHSQGIVYRDLKPENILLDFQGHIVLTDFGLCKEGVAGTETTSTFCGTPEYLAPEVLRKAAYDRSVDWWCLGVVLYEMLFGLPPFYSRDTAEMYDNILHKPLRLRSTITTAAKNILEGLLEKEKEKRLGSGEGDFRDVKNHEFFETINWKDLEEKKNQPPYLPNLQGAFDFKNIDPEFTKEPIPASIGQSVHSITTSVQESNVFEGFSYVPTGILL